MFNLDSITCSNSLVSRSGADPERLLLGQIVGTARRLAVDQGSIATALTAIRGVAGGREDLLTQGAGLGIGAWSTNPGMPTDILAATLLLSSVQHLELDALGQWLVTGQQRGLSGVRHRA